MSEVKRFSEDRIEEMLGACDLKAFKEEYWYPELAHSATIHAENLKTLKLGTKFHLELILRFYLNNMFNHKLS